MLQQLEAHIKKVIREERKGIGPFFLKGFLRLASWFFRFGITCRNRAFDRGWLRRYHPPVPVVISIGNIVAGGTGKTPLTQLIAQSLSKEFKIAILSRGYRSPAEKFSDPVMLSKGAGPLYPATLCGDEPYMLSQETPEALVFVGRDRQKSCHLAAKAGAQIILLDDAMQHRQVARDFDIAVINANDPFGKGYFLPRGFLRDPPHSLSRANLIVLNHIANDGHYDSIKKRIERYTKAPIIGTKLVISHYVDLQGNTFKSISGKRVGIFCGIGHPEEFKSLMQKQEISILDEYFTPDHILPSHESLLNFAIRCSKKGADFLVCTEKDRVKLHEKWEGPIPIIWTKADLHVVKGLDHWNQFIQQARTKAS